MEETVMIETGSTGKSPKNTFKELTVSELSSTLSTSIKEDKFCKAICFLGMLLTYTLEDQQNMAFNAEASVGKSYVVLEVASYFPSEDVQELGYCSPTSFFHEQGIWIKKTKIKHIDLERKILIFLDQPHDLLLQRLRPLLSHDKKELSFKITDKTAKGTLSTKHIVIKGYPTVTFCSANGLRQDQEKTRMFLLSPESTQPKLKESLKLIAFKQGDKKKYLKEIDEDANRQNLKMRIEAIKKLAVSHIEVPQWDKVYDRFIKNRQYLQPRHQRDFPRLFALIKAWGLLNAWHREQKQDFDGLTIYANDKDINVGFWLYDKIVRSNEVGLTPEQLEIFEKVIKSHFVSKELNNAGMDALGYSEIAQHYLTTFHRPITEWRLKHDVIPALISAGLICQGNDANDKRKTAFFPLENNG